jgi:hypothetical protein
LESKDPARRTRFDTMLIAVLCLVVLGIAFELYGHYTYVHTRGMTVVRIDRVTGATCTMPCTGAPDGAPLEVDPNPSPSDPVGKTCHSANVVRVASAMPIPAGRAPVAYNAGGFEPGSPIVRRWKRHIIPYASELSDGHVYAFSATAFSAVSTWSTGDNVQVCATWSEIERRPFYSVGGTDDAEPATVAI